MTSNCRFRRKLGKIIWQPCSPPPLEHCHHHRFWQPFARWCSHCGIGSADLAQYNGELVVEVALQTRVKRKQIQNTGAEMLEGAQIHHVENIVLNMPNIQPTAHVAKQGMLPCEKPLRSINETVAPTSVWPHVREWHR